MGKFVLDIPEIAMLAALDAVKSELDYQRRRWGDRQEPYQGPPAEGFIYTFSEHPHTIYDWVTFMRVWTRTAEDAFATSGSVAAMTHIRKVAALSWRGLQCFDAVPADALPSLDSVASIPSMGNVISYESWLPELSSLDAARRGVGCVLRNITGFLDCFDDLGDLRPPAMTPSRGTTMLSRISSLCLSACVVHGVSLRDEPHVFNARDLKPA